MKKPAQRRHPKKPKDAPIYFDRSETPVLPVFSKLDAPSYFPTQQQECSVRTMKLDGNPSHQVQECVLQIVDLYMTKWGKKFLCLWNEKDTLRKELQGSDKEDRIAREFAKHKVNYEEIASLFWTRWTGAVFLLTVMVAATTTDKDYRKQVRQYARAVNQITTEQAPFPITLKAQLREMYSALLGVRPGARVINLFKSLVEKHQRTFNQKLDEDWLLQALLGHRSQAELKQELDKIPPLLLLDYNVNKAFHRHPVWKTLQMELFDVLNSKKVTNRQAYRLINRLFKAFVPGWDKIQNPEDTIRLAIRYRRQTNRSM